MPMKFESGKVTYDYDATVPIQLISDVDEKIGLVKSRVESNCDNLKRRIEQNHDIVMNVIKEEIITSFLIDYDLIDIAYTDRIILTRILLCRPVRWLNKIFHWYSYKLSFSEYNTPFLGITNDVSDYKNDMVQIKNYISTQRLDGRMVTFKQLVSITIDALNSAKSTMADKNRVSRKTGS